MIEAISSVLICLALITIFCYWQILKENDRLDAESNKYPSAGPPTNPRNRIIKKELDYLLEFDDSEKFYHN